MNNNEKMMKLAKENLQIGEDLGKVTDIAQAMDAAADIRDYNASSTIIKALADRLRKMGIHAIDIRVNSRDMIKMLTKEVVEPTEEEMAAVREVIGDD